MTRCLFCGEPEILEVIEHSYEERAFIIETCCIDSHEYWLVEMQLWDRETWRAFLNRAGISARRALPGCEAVEGTSWPIDYGLEVVPVRQSQAKAFVRAHHAHLPSPPAGWRFGFGVRNGPDLLGVVMVGRPVARKLDAASIVEVNRLCVRRDLGPDLAWNACSMLYGAAAKEGRARGFELLLTYTLEREEGASLRAAGFVEHGVTKGGSWASKGRPRNTNAKTAGPKTRWVRPLRKGASLELAA